MDLLIVYSEEKKGELLSLATILHQQEVRFTPTPLPQQWTVFDSESLILALKAHSHWLFLVTPDDVKNPAFLLAAGYCIAIHERCYLLGIAGDLVPGYWKSQLNLCPDLAFLVQSLEIEQKRWQLFLARQAAKEKLLERGLEPTNSAFWESVEKGDLGSCELFLQAGFSPDLANKKGVSVLGMAVRSAHLGVLRILLEAGADVNLRSKDRDNSPLMDAAAEGLTDLVVELIRRGADLGGVSRNGQNALVLAIGKGAQDVATLLLEAGGDPFIADKLGMNACQYAQLLGRKEFLAQVAQKFPGRVLAG